MLLKRPRSLAKTSSVHPGILQPPSSAPNPIRNTPRPPHAHPPCCVRPPSRKLYPSSSIRHPPSSILHPTSPPYIHPRTLHPASIILPDSIVHRPCNALFPHTIQHPSAKLNATPSICKPQSGIRHHPTSSSDRESDKQADKQTGGETDRHTGRHTTMCDIQTGNKTDWRVTYIHRTRLNHITYS